MTKVKIIIPVYKKTLTEYEKMSLVQCCKILNKYLFSIVCPEKLDLSYYEKILKEYNVIYDVNRHPAENFASIKKYNDLLLNKLFYERFIDYEFILIYQLDAFVFRDELEYWCNQNFDYIGAPWFEGFNLGSKNAEILNKAGNGGFSLRKVSSILRLLHDEKIYEYITDETNEDLFYSEIGPKIDPEFKIAPSNIAMYFSFECQPGRLFHLTGEKLPFGCHAWEKNDPDFWQKYITGDSRDMSFEFSVMKMEFEGAKEKFEQAKEKFGCLIDEKQSQIDCARSEILKLETRLQASEDDRLEKLEIIHKLSEQLMEAEAEINRFEVRLNESETDREAKLDEIQRLANELNGIYASRTWKVAGILRESAGFLFPIGTVRRRAAEIMWKAASNFLRLLAASIIKIKTLFFVGKRPHIETGTRGKRTINLKSNKLVYIGHSYHAKTKSTEFLINYLKEKFEVTVILDESWLGRPYPDLSFIDESYLGVIFFQNLPSREALNNMGNNNLIYFPMYDGVRHDYLFWKDYYDLKIINFSRKLHENLSGWGLNSIYIQYFPAPDEFMPGKKDELFFWQRINQININVLARLLKSQKVRIHLHKAVDPNHKFVAPSKEQEEKFKITYSEWFDEREKMLEIIRMKGIYVAPREFEGIGLSFLEAMAMGKAVICVNNPTMNEYIKNNKTGYLYDLNSPGEIDLTNIEEVQKNAYAYMQDGYHQWNKRKSEIIDFIRQQ